MTTIAYKDRKIASDCGITSYNHVADGFMRKFVNKNGVFALAAGNVSVVSHFLDWFKDGCKGIYHNKGDDADLMIITPDGKAVIFAGTYMSLSKCDCIAIGSGAQIAIGAMYAGASALEAVKIARKVDAHTFGPIITDSH